MNTKRLRRIGCGLLLIPWFVLLLTPCFVITLLAQQEIRVTWSDVPDDAFRIWLISEREARGLGVATSRRVEVSPQTVCTVIDVNFFMWQGDPNKIGALPSHQCACYRRDPGRFFALSVGPEACLTAGEQPTAAP
jgi:hypothetical protein